MKSYKYVIVEVLLHVFLTSAMDEGEWSLHAPAALPPVKECTVPIGLEAGWAPDLV
jgi:hypothetical protein